MRTELPWVTRSSLPRAIPAQTSALVRPCPTSQLQTYTTRQEQGHRDFHTMQLEPSLHARPLLPSHAHQDSPAITDPACSVAPSRLTAYLTAMAAKKSGTNPASELPQAEPPALSTASHHTRPASAYRLGART